jgi:hypothetical protein
VSKDQEREQRIAARERQILADEPAKERRIAERERQYLAEAEQKGKGR